MPERDTEGEHYCRCCDQEYCLRTNREPTDYCDDCAQNLVPLLYKELLDAQTTLLNAYAIRVKINGVAGGKLKNQLDRISAVLSKAKGEVPL